MGWWVGAGGGCEGDGSSDRCVGFECFNDASSQVHNRAYMNYNLKSPCVVAAVSVSVPARCRGNPQLASDATAIRACINGIASRADTHTVINSSKATANAKQEKQPQREAASVAAASASVTPTCAEQV